MSAGAPWTLALSLPSGGASTSPLPASRRSAMLCTTNASRTARREPVPACSLARASTAHWNTARSCPPTDTTRFPSPEKRTFVTWDEWPT